jgi:hypothetical protein
LARNCPIKTSLSYVFLEHPKVMTLILFFLTDLVLIVFEKWTAKLGYLFQSQKGNRIKKAIDNRRLL